DVGNNGSASLFEPCPKGIIRRALGLDDVGARVTAGLKMARDVECNAICSIQQSILQQNRSISRCELFEWQRCIAKAVWELRAILLRIGLGQCLREVNGRRTT